MKNNLKYTIVGGSGFVGTNLINQLGKINCYNIDKKQSATFSDITIIKDIRELNLADKIPVDTHTVVLLAAEHRDDVYPTTLYYDVNVQGTLNVLDAMNINNINNIIFTSSVAVYGLNKINPNEEHQVDPFNHYGKSKFQAEEILRKWYQNDPEKRSLTIIRPTVIFGERNRGNVYNLLKQIALGNFIMVGKGTNKKSMAYVGNIVAFIEHCLSSQKPGYRIFNYIDKPELNMNELVKQVEKSLNKKLPSIRLPYWLGYLGGLIFDIIAFITGRKYSINAIRVKKFCATTQFDSTAAHSSGFNAPYTLAEGLHRTLKYEFLVTKEDEVYFDSE